MRLAAPVPLAVIGTLLIPMSARAAAPEARMLAVADVGATSGLTGELSVSDPTAIGDHLTVRFTAPSGDGSLILWMPNDRAPAVGDYPGAVSIGERTPDQPALAINGPAACPGALSGRFTITDLRVAGSLVERLHATFDLTCAGDPGAQHGEVRILIRHTPTWRTVAARATHAEWAVGVVGRTMVWTSASAGHGRRGQLQRGTAAPRGFALPAGGFLAGFGASYLVGGVNSSDGGQAPLVLSASTLRRRRAPGGISRAGWFSWIEDTDGRYWQYLRRTPSNSRRELRLLDARTHRDLLLSSGTPDGGSIANGYVAWSECGKNGGDCTVAVRRLAGGKAWRVKPPKGRGYYGVGLSADHVVYAVDGATKGCGVRTRIVRVARNGTVTPLARLAANVDAENISVVQANGYDRLLLVTVDCAQGRSVDTDVQTLEVDPATLPALA